MKSIFEERAITFERKDKSVLTVDKDGVRLRGAKKDIDISFENTIYVEAQKYATENRHYFILAPQKDGAELIQLDTDIDANHHTHNILETKTILTAFAASKLGRKFPNNLDDLEINLGRTIARKDFILSHGEIIGPQKKLALKDIQRAACRGAVLSNIFIYTNEKKRLFEKPQMTVPANVLSLYIVEAALTRNTGHGIDFSQVDPMTGMENSEYLILRYLDSNFFVNEEDGFDSDWAKVVHDRIENYGWDINMIVGQED